MSSNNELINGDEFSKMNVQMAAIEKLDLYGRMCPHCKGKPVFDFNNQSFIKLYCSGCGVHIEIKSGTFHDQVVHAFKDWNEYAEKHEINYTNLSSAWLEPSYWIKIAVDFINENSKLTPRQIIEQINNIIFNTPSTFHEIFEVCLKVKKLDPKINFNISFFHEIKELSRRGVNTVIASKKLKEVMGKLKR